MFQVGDYIVYGSKGVCEVKDITTLNMEGVSKDRLYYELQPCFLRGSRIFTPTEPEKGKNVMRPVLTREEAVSLLDGFTCDKQQAWIEDDRAREADFKDTLSSCDALRMLRMIRLLYLRRQERAAIGRKLTAIDSKYLHSAEENLFSELSLCLQQPVETVGRRLEEKLVALK